MDVQTEVHIPTIYASTTQISDGNSIFGYWGPEGNLNASGTLLIDGIFTPSGGISTSTLDNIIIGGSTASNAWFDKLHASSTTQGALLDLLTVYATTTLSGIGADLIVQGVSTSTFLGNLTVDWSVGFGSFASSTRALTNNTIDFGAYDGAWRDVYTSGTLYIYNIEADGSISSSSTATSTFQGGMQATQFDATGSATNTFAGDIQLASGKCVQDSDGNCVTGGVSWTLLSSVTGSNLIGDGAYVEAEVATGTKVIVVDMAWANQPTTDSVVSTQFTIFKTGIGADSTSTKPCFDGTYAEGDEVAAQWKSTDQQFGNWGALGLFGDAVGGDNFFYHIYYYK